MGIFCSAAFVIDSPLNSVPGGKKESHYDNLLWIIDVYVCCRNATSAVIRRCHLPKKEREKELRSSFGLKTRASKMFEGTETKTNRKRLFFHSGQKIKKLSILHLLSVTITPVFSEHFAWNGCHLIAAKMTCLYLLGRILDELTPRTIELSLTTQFPKMELILGDFGVLLIEWLKRKPEFH